MRERINSAPTVDLLPEHSTSVKKAPVRRTTTSSRRHVVRRKSTSTVCQQHWLGRPVCLLCVCGALLLLCEPLLHCLLPALTLSSLYFLMVRALKPDLKRVVCFACSQLVCDTVLVVVSGRVPERLLLALVLLCSALPLLLTLLLYLHTSRALSVGAGAAACDTPAGSRRTPPKCTQPLIIVSAPRRPADEQQQQPVVSRLSHVSQQHPAVCTCAVHLLLRAAALRAISSVTGVALRALAIDCLLLCVAVSMSHDLSAKFSKHVAFIGAAIKEEGADGLDVSCSRARSHQPQQPAGISARNRRCSLPAQSHSLHASRNHQHNVSAARGMLADLLASRDLPSHVAACLKAVNSLLSPQPVAGAVSFHNDLGLPPVVTDPYSGECLLVDTSKNRVSSVAFSTVTSATGLPTIVAEPNKARSSSYWKQRSHEEIDNEDEQAQRNGQTPDVLPNGPGNRTSYKAAVDAMVFDLVALKNDARLSPEELKRWEFPLLEYSLSCPKSVLTNIACNIFRHTNLNRIFNISWQKFINFFHQLELGYWEIAYHNRMHAADVLHGVYYLVVHGVPAVPAAEPEQPAADADSLTVTLRHSTAGSDVSSSTSLNASYVKASLHSVHSTMNGLEVLALFTAAAMHDYDHPGKTNAFLVAVEDKKAILYNDRSVLENHHAAAGWALLCRPENCFVDQLDAAEMKRFRYMVLELILATDLKRHFEVIMDFNSKVKSESLDFAEESDRMLISEMCIKMADINSPCKPFAVHRSWTDRILSEFYAQGDEEKKRGMSVSPYMDREEPQVAKLQDSFIAHLVCPLAQAMADAGLLPSTSAEPVDVDEDDEPPEPDLIAYLMQNHEHWKQQLSGTDEDEGMGRINEVEEEDTTL